MESGLKCLNVIALDNKVVFVLNLYFLIYFKKNISQQEHWTTVLKLNMKTDIYGTTLWL